MIKFLDTSSLLLQIPIDFFYLSDITLMELEGIKNSANKDFEIKQKARTVSRFIMENYSNNKFKIINYDINQLDYILDPEDDRIKANNDLKILACACWLRHFHPDEEFVFYTNDVNLFNLANCKGIKVKQVEPIVEDYNGYIEVTLNDEEMADYYSHLGCNYFNLYVGEYAIIYNANQEVVDIACWEGSKMRSITYPNLCSDYFGKLKAKNDDPYQKIACDSLMNNQLTVLRGPAGSGKSYLGLGYLFSLLDNGKIDKIIMFVNPMAERNSCKFGFLPGTLLEKILGSQIGNFLSSKLGGIETVYSLVDEGKLEFIATADARGYDTSNMKCGIFMTEAQNTTIDMMKLLLERFGEDTIGVFEGDTECQVDHVSYENGNNGLRRVCEVYKGQPYFGTVTLKNCYRSKIAAQALKM